MIPCCHALQGPSEKEPTVKGKNLLPTGSKFFPFRVGSVLEGREEAF